MEKVSLDVFTRFPNLEYLNLANTQITALDNSMCEFGLNLKTIDIGNNKIVALDLTTLLKCTKLELLIALGNPIKEIDAGKTEVYPFQIWV